jgi:broad specificity phosphatase PhoE
MSERILYLVRHGQYRMDRETASQATLTALGRRQAGRTGKRLGELPIRALYHSDMVRAVETAEIIGRHLPGLALRSTALLREVKPPLEKPLRRPSNLPAEAEWMASRQQMNGALRKFFVEAAGKSDRHELLVTHGNLIRCLIRRLLHDSFGGWVNWGTHQCGITTIVIPAAPAKPRLIGYNDVGHLPKKMQTVF